MVISDFAHHRDLSFANSLWVAMADLLAHVSNNKVRIGVDPVRGRGGYARTSIRAGELICQSQPFAVCVGAENLRTHCHECFEAGDKLFRCTACSQARYCSKECQRAAWAIHKFECPIWKSPSLWEAMEEIHVDDQSSVLLALRVFINRNRWKEMNLTISQYFQEWTRILEFCGTEADRESHELFEFDDTTPSKLAHLLLHCGAPVHSVLCEPSDTEEFVSEIFMKMQKNNFQLVDSVFRNEGTAVYPVGALLNHSCYPNCIIAYEYDPDKRQYMQKVRALRPVKANEELTHSYIDTAMPTVERRRRLHHQFDFVCSCSRCTHEQAEEEDRLLEGLLSPEAREALGGEGAKELKLADVLYGVAAMKESEEEQMAMYEECLRLRLMNLYELSLPVFLTWCRLFDIYLNLAPDKAISACERICECYERGPLYGNQASIHPLLGLQNFTLGDILFDLCCQQHEQGKVDPHLLRRSRQAYEKALRILTVTHGSDHHLVLYLKDQLRK